MNIAIFIVAGIAFIVGYAVGGGLAIKDMRDDTDGVAFIDNGKENIVLTTPHSKAKKKNILIFKVCNSEKED